MKLEDFHRVYFVGIGGIGMSAIARYLRDIGKEVFGYDKTQTLLTDTLSEEGMVISYRDEIDDIPPDLDLVIYTPAVPSYHPKMVYLQELGMPFIKRSKALGWISKSTRCIAVAGTHGKTTTSSLVSEVLKVGEISFAAFLGGISYGLGSNYRSYGTDWMVVEADEYDRSFLQLNPDIAILLSMDPDHLDIYGNQDEMHRGFWEFILQIKPNGTLIYREGLDDMFPNDWQSTLGERQVSWISFGINNGIVYASDIQVVEGKFRFLYDGLDNVIKMSSGMPGRHNIENAIAALIVGERLGIRKEYLQAAIEEFPGIYRRFERLYEDDSRLYIDDYAHHPSELRSAIGAARELFPDRKLIGIFQPHLYTRTRDFVTGFVEQLDVLDTIFLLEIYPARELPLEGVTSDWLLEKLCSQQKSLVHDIADVTSYLDNQNDYVLLTLGAGDIDLWRAPLVAYLKSND